MSYKTVTYFQSVKIVILSYFKTISRSYPSMIKPSCMCTLYRSGCLVKLSELEASVNYTLPLVSKMGNCLRRTSQLRQDLIKRLYFLFTNVVLTLNELGNVEILTFSLFSTYIKLIYFKLYFNFGLNFFSSVFISTSGSNYKYKVMCKVARNFLIVI